MEAQVAKALADVISTSTATTTTATTTTTNNTASSSQSTLTTINNDIGKSSAVTSATATTTAGNTKSTAKPPTTPSPFLSSHEPTTEIREGVEWVSFVYSHHRTLRRYCIRTDLDKVDTNILDEKFKKENCVSVFTPVKFFYITGLKKEKKKIGLSSSEFTKRNVSWQSMGLRNRMQ